MDGAAGFDFDADTAVELARPGRWRGTVTRRWHIGNVPNGGYVLCIALSAIRRSVRHPHVLTATCHFLAPCREGPVEVDVDVVKEGRTISTATARLRQGDRTCVLVIASYGDLDTQSGPSLVTAVVPDLPAPEDCGFPGDRPVPAGFTSAAIVDRVDFRPSPATAARLRARNGAPHLEGWIGFRDGRPPDVDSLPLLVDASPPAVFAAMETGWVPTLELTVHVRAVPAPGWLADQVRTRLLVDGLLEEECELWDATGRLVAMSRQLARVLPPAR